MMWCQDCRTLFLALYRVSKIRRMNDMGPETGQTGKIGTHEDTWRVMRWHSGATCENDHTVRYHPTT
jgi:hypothetical protein